MALIIAALALAMYIYTNSIPSEIETKGNELKDYSRKDFEISGIMPKEEDSSRDWYAYITAKENINFLKEGNPLPSSEYLEISDFFEKKFGEGCPQGSPEECDPYNELLPYCISKKVAWMERNGSAEGLSEEMSKNPVYTAAVNYWKEYIEREEMKEEDLPVIVGIVVMERTCGNLRKEESEKWLEILLKIKIANIQPIEGRMDSLKKKVATINALQTINPLNPTPESKALKNTLCKLPRIVEIEKANDVCTSFNYFKVKGICFGVLAISSAEDQTLVLKHLGERYSDAEKINCQLGLYMASGT